MKLTPIEENVSRLQDEGHDVYIHGWNERGTYCLIVSPKGVTVASYLTCNGIGRWTDDRVTSTLARVFSGRTPKP